MMMLAVDKGSEQLGDCNIKSKRFSTLNYQGHTSQINQFYNKKKGKLQSELKDAKSSNRIKR